KAEGLRLARGPGYRDQILQDMREAARLDVPGRDPNDIRKAVLACLGDPLGLHPVHGMMVVRGRRPPIPNAFEEIIRKGRDRERPGAAATPDGNWLGLAPGCGHIMLFHKDGRDPVDKELPRLGAVYDLEISRDGRFLAAGFEEGAAVWTTPDLGLH